MVNSTSCSPHLDLRQLSDAQLHALADRIEAENPWSGLRYYILCTPRRFLVTFWAATMLIILPASWIVKISFIGSALLYDLAVTSKAPDVKLTIRDVVFHFSQYWEDNNSHKKFSYQVHYIVWILYSLITSVIITLATLHSNSGQLFNITLITAVIYLITLAAMSILIAKSKATRPFFSVAAKEPFTKNDKRKKLAALLALTFIGVPLFFIGLTVDIAAESSLQPQSVMEIFQKNLAIGLMFFFLNYAWLLSSYYKHVFIAHDIKNSLRGEI